MRAVLLGKLIGALLFLALCLGVALFTPIARRLLGNKNNRRS